MTRRIFTLEGYVTTPPLSFRPTGAGVGRRSLPEHTLDPSDSNTALRLVYFTGTQLIRIRIPAVRTR